MDQLCFNLDGFTELYYAQNKDAIKERYKQLEAEHKAKTAEYYKKYYKEKKERYIEYNKKNKEHIAEYYRKYYIEKNAETNRINRIKRFKLRTMARRKAQEVWG